MASVLLSLRFITFGFFIVCNTILCSVAVWNLSLVQTRSYYNARISAYVIFLGGFGLLWVFPIIFIDLLRRDALTSRVWFELVWVAVFWIMELSGAAALSAIVPDNQCLAHRGETAVRTCVSGKVLLGFAWIITLILLGYMTMLAVYAIVHHTTDPNVWYDTVRDYPWFSTRSTLSSSPPTPVTEKGPKIPSLRHPRPKAAFNPEGLTRSLSPLEETIRPVPTFEKIPQPSYQAPQRTYGGPHFTMVQDSVPVIEPTFSRPRDAPRPPVKMQSLYPEHLQAHLPMEAHNNLQNQSRQHDGQEPSPIGDWPRASRSRSRRHHKRLPPPPRPNINTKVNALTQQPLSSISPDQRTRLSETTNVSSSPSYSLQSPVWGPQSASVRRHLPPPLNLDGISNVTYAARR